MRNGVSKAVIGGLAALSIGTATLMASAPASAQQWRGGGGWRGGGWHGGGWHGGGSGWRGGYWGGRGYRGGGGWWWAPAIVAGALTAGAIAGYPYYGYGYNSCWQVRPVYDAYGNYIGQSRVNVCY